MSVHQWTTTVSQHIHMFWIQINQGCWCFVQQFSFSTTAGNPQEKIKCSQAEKLGRARKWTDDQRNALHYALCQIHSLVIFREVLILKLSIFITLKGCISQRVDRWWENGSTLPWVWMYPYTAEMRDVFGNTSPEAREISRGPGMQNPHPREI